MKTRKFNTNPCETLMLALFIAIRKRLRIVQTVHY